MTTLTKWRLKIALKKTLAVFIIIFIVYFLCNIVPILFIEKYKIIPIEIAVIVMVITISASTLILFLIFYLGENKHSVIFYLEEKIKKTEKKQYFSERKEELGYEIMLICKKPDIVDVFLETDFSKP